MAANSSSLQQRDVRASNLRSQAESQKAEQDALIKASFASNASHTRPTRSRPHAAHVSSKLLDPDVDFARKNLRNTYVNLLFTCTFTRAAHSVDSLIWTDTSYSLINAFRSHLSALEKTLASHPGGAGASAKKNKVRHQVQRAKAELNKLLMDEETFWLELIARIVRMFSLHEAKTNLEALGIQCESDGDTSVGTVTQQSDSFTSGLGRQLSEPDQALSQAALLPANRNHLLEIVHRSLIFCGDLSRYRQLFCHSLNANDQEEPSADVHRASRSTKSRPGPNSIDAPARTSKYDFTRATAFYDQARQLLPDNGNPSNQLAVVATYNTDLFSSLYHYYRALCVRYPFEKSKVNLEKLLIKPVDLWRESSIDLVKQWDDAKDKQARDPLLVEILSTDLATSEEMSTSWFKSVIVLHGLFFQRTHLDCIMPISNLVLATFSSLLRARALQADQIVHVVVAALCASWTTRLWRNSPSSSASKSAQLKRTRDGDDGVQHRPKPRRASRDLKPQPDPETRLCIEHQILAHVLGIFRELAEVDTAETQEAIKLSRSSMPSELIGAKRDVNTNAVRHLTTVVRRTLPALRIATKWMKTHLEYIQRSSERVAASSSKDFASTTSRTDSNPSMEANPDEVELQQAQIRAKADAAASRAIESFWTSYVNLINMLRYAFPFESLPNIGKVGPVGAPALCLEEDSDMRGFAPTRKATQATVPGGGVINVGMGEACTHFNSVRPSQVHPNEEQLMRIADLLIDAKVVAESDASPISFDDDNNIFKYEKPSLSSPRDPLPVEHAFRPTVAEINPTVLPHASLNEQTVAQTNQDEALSEGFSEMTDDPVELAMRAVDGRRTGEGSIMDGVEESFREVHVGTSMHQDKGYDDTEDHILIPSQVRSKKYDKDLDFGRIFSNQPFDAPAAAYGVHADAAHLSSHDPTASLSQQMANNSSFPRPATAQDLLLQMLNRPSGGLAMGNPSEPAQPHLLFGGMAAPTDMTNQQRRNSIWSPGPADSHMAVGSPPGANAYGLNAHMLAMSTAQTQHYPWNPILQPAYDGNGGDIPTSMISYPTPPAITPSNSQSFTSTPGFPVQSLPSPHHHPHHYHQTSPSPAFHLARGHATPNAFLSTHFNSQFSQDPAIASSRNERINDSGSDLMRGAVGGDGYHHGRIDPTLQTDPSAWTHFYPGDS